MKKIDDIATYILRHIIMRDPVILEEEFNKDNGYVFSYGCGHSYLSGIPMFSVRKPVMKYRRFPFFERVWV